MKLDLLHVVKDLSHQMVDNHSELVEVGKCYDNVAQIVINGDISSYENLQVAYGGVEIVPHTNVYAQHAYFILDGTVIDPTLGIRGIDTDFKYLNLRVFDVPEYRAFISEHRHSSPDIIMNEFKKKSQELFAHDIYLI